MPGVRGLYIRERVRRADRNGVRLTAQRAGPAQMRIYGEGEGSPGVLAGMRGRSHERHDHHECAHQQDCDDGVGVAGDVSVEEHGFRPFTGLDGGPPVKV